ncbi:MAG: AAA family ATPase [Treponema sp.]|jgi:MoxR-like ATPase|nr:AAA family ATPase [Treponema sp.]
MAVKSQIIRLLKELNTGIYEKEEILALALLTAVAGESLFLLGPPGVGKSLIARRLKYAFKQGRAFEYLMSRFSTPDEIFGPLSIAKLKDADKYERITQGYLPEASVVFLDEIWKAGPSIQNALLTVLNEKLYRNGEQEIPIPMKLLIAASNEMPLPGQGLEALWDRFLVRLPVDGINDPEHFRAMITLPRSFDTSTHDPVPEEQKITDPVYEGWSRGIDAITLPDHVFQVLWFIKSQGTRNLGEGEPAEPDLPPPQEALQQKSDRRWRKIVRLLRTSAFLNDRKQVDLMDCFLVKHCLWNDPSTLTAATRLVHEAIEQQGYSAALDFTGLREELRALQSEITRETRRIEDTRAEVLRLITPDYYRIISDDSPERYIKKQDFEGLSAEAQTLPLYVRQRLASGYLHRNRSAQLQKGAGTFSIQVDGIEQDMETLMSRQGSAQVSQGGGPFQLVVDGRECTLDTMPTGDKRRISRKPVPAQERAWDTRIQGFLDYTAGMKRRLAQHEKQGYKHLRVNLFVPPALASLVESHIARTYKELDKLEVEIREIQHAYKTLTDEAVSLR